MTGVILAAAFVHPALAAAAVAGGLIPVLIHLIYRRHHRRQTWAAMAFLLAARRRTARRLRMQNWLLLAVRICIVLLVGLAIARPLLDRAQAAALTAPRCHRIVVVDDSLSMLAAGPGGKSRFAAAVSCTSRLLDTFADGDELSIITLAAPTEPHIEHGTFDRRLWRDHLVSLACTERAADVVGALGIAARTVETSSIAPGHHFVYIVSDFAAGSWATAGPKGGRIARSLAQLADRLGAHPGHVQLVPIRHDMQDNLAITSFEADAPVIAVGRPIRLTAKVTNLGPAPAGGGAIQFRCAGQIIHQVSLPAIPGGNEVVIESATLFAEPGSHGLEARLTASTSDALQADDSRFLVIHINGSRDILLVDGAPGVHRFAGSTGYLSTALAPEQVLAAQGLATWTDDHNPAVFAPKVAVPADLETEVLDDYAAVALSNVANLPAETWQRLATYVDRGGALVILLGDRVDLDHYNAVRLLDGARLLPGRLISLWPLDDAVDIATGFALTDPPHPIFKDFVDRPTCGLFTAQARRYAQIAVDEDRGEVAFRYATGDPALVVASTGSGTVAVWTTSADMSWCNLPSRGDYVSTMVSLFGYLLSAQSSGHDIAVGDTFTLPLDASEVARTVTATHSRDGEASGRLVPHRNGLAYAYGPTTKSGLVAIHAGASSCHAAINTEVVESNVASLTDDALLAAAGSSALIVHPDKIGQPSAAPAATSELASIGLWTALVLLIVESGLSKRFGTEG